MKGELVKFRASDGWWLEGFLVLPKRRAKTALVFVHGMGSFFWSGVASRIYPAVLGAGLAFFPFNNRGSAILRRFYSKRGHKHTSHVSGVAVERFTDCVDDIDGALAFLKKRGFTRFILVGHSTGCQKITYYQGKRKNPAVVGLVLLAPADDLNCGKKEFGRRFPSVLANARRLVREGRGGELLPKKMGGPSFSAVRFYELHKPDSIEGNVFNYSRELRALRKIKKPIFAAFGKNEEHTVIPAKRMLEKIRATNTLATTALVPGDHGFKGGERQLQKALGVWLRGVRP